MLEPSTQAPGSLFVQRLEGSAWSPPVGIAPSVNNVDFRLLGNAKGRLTALVTDSLPYRLNYTTSTDGGVLWSSLVTVALYGGYPSRPRDVDGERRRRARRRSTTSSTTSPCASRASARPRRVARRRIGGARVQVRSVCDGAKLSLVVEAARGNRRVSPSTVLRRARFGRARGARRGFRTLPRELRAAPPHARIPVRVIPRRGKARTLRLRVRRCGATR